LECHSSAGIRRPDLGDQAVSGSLFGHFSRRPDTPLPSFYLAVDFPGLRRNVSWSQIINQAQDFPEQFPRHRHLGQLERDVPAMADNFSSNLD